MLLAEQLLGDDRSAVTIKKGFAHCSNFVVLDNKQLPSSRSASVHAFDKQVWTARRISINVQINSPSTYKSRHVRKSLLKRSISFRANKQTKRLILRASTKLPVLRIYFYFSIDWISPRDNSRARARNTHNGCTDMWPLLIDFVQESINYTTDGVVQLVIPTPFISNAIVYITTYTYWTYQKLHVRRKHQSFARTANTKS